MNWWLKSFGGVPLPRGNFTFDQPRTLLNEPAPVIGSHGVYWLNGARPNIGAQSYVYEFRVANQFVNDLMDALLQAAQAEGTLYKTDGLLTLDTVGRISAITDASNGEDWRRGQKTIRIEFVCEPFWYGKTWSVTINKSGGGSAVVANASSPSNALNWGTAPSIKHTRFTASTKADGGDITLFTKIGSTIYTTVTIGEMVLAEVPWYVDAGVPEVIGSASGNMWRYVSRPATQLPLFAIPPVRRVGGKVDPTFEMTLDWTTPTPEIIGVFTWRDCYL